jgi:hypothetical protein
LTRKEQKKRQKQLEYEQELKAMGSKAFEPEPENAEERIRGFYEALQLLI